jgi:hypothetical protein
MRSHHLRGAVVGKKIADTVDQDGSQERLFDDGDPAVAARSRSTAVG